MKSVIAIVALCALSVAGQVCVRRHRPVAAPALAESALTAFGGLRSVAAEIVWFRADRLQDEGRYVELAQLAHALTLSEPHTPEVWSYAAWNLAYNVSVMMATPEDRWRWVQAALRLLRDDGLRLNPQSAELCRELAWLFELKIGADIDTAAPLYREKWKSAVEDVARRDAWEELGMDRARMAELERSTGMTERTDPQYSAAYWAARGLRCCRKKADAQMLSAILRQAQLIYARKRGRKNEATAT